MFLCQTCFSGLIEYKNKTHGQENRGRAVRIALVLFQSRIPRNKQELCEQMQFFNRITKASRIRSMNSTGK